MMVSIIEIVLYTKPTAEHQYLLRSLCHPLHTKRAFPFSLALRIRRIGSCSNETLKLRCNELKHKHNALTDVDTISVSSNRIYSVFILSHTLAQATHQHVSSCTCCRIPPSHSLNIIYLSRKHLHSLILLTLCYYQCLNINLSLPSYVLKSRKSVE